jgi:DNA (cytosine-5)-methyltransferase 1
MVKRTKRARHAAGMFDELIVDGFAGGGGASIGMERGMGRAVDIAINHDRTAVAFHQANHPHTLHYCESVYKVRPEKVTRGRPVGLAWFSPDCKDHSNAKGGQPVSARIRGLAWVVIRWARQPNKPRVIMLENVREFCFPANTAVLTKRGVIPIGEIEVGDEVWTHNARWKPVTSVVRRRSSTVRINGYGNNIIETTPNHQFYARQFAPCITQSGKYGRHETRLLEPEWVRADRLADHDNTSTYTEKYSGYAWATPCELPRYWMRLPEALGVDCSAPAFFYMLGRWLGDGWIKKRKQRHNQNIVRICANLPEADDLQEMLAATGLSWRRAKHAVSVDVFDLAVESSRILIPWLRRHFGEYAEGKTLPAWIFGATEEQRWGLIKGYLDSDGRQFGDTELSTTSVSRCLAVGIKLLLQSLGIAASISKTERGELPSVNNPLLTTDYADAYHVSWRSEVQWEKCHRRDLHIWGPVREVNEASADAEVVDITVADDHSLIADGQVVHNCGWGPLIPMIDADGKPLLHPDGSPKMKRDPARKGLTFKKWVGQLRNLGYEVEHRILNAADYGAPTTRKRIFLVARCDGQPIVWPEPTHGPGRAKPYRTAAECIDFTLPCPSIFLTHEEGIKAHCNRPLKPKTMRRIALGIKRFVLDNPNPFIVQVNHGGAEFRGQKPDRPLATVTGKHGYGLVTPFFNAQFGEAPGQVPRTHAVDEPIPVITPRHGGGFPLMTAHLMPHYGGSGQVDIECPAPTIVARNHHAMIAASLVQYNGEQGPNEVRGCSVDGPVNVITPDPRFALCSAFLSQHYGDRPDGSSRAGMPVDGPLPTTTGRGTQNMLAAANIVRIGQAGGNGSYVNAADSPLTTITSKAEHCIAAANMIKMNFGDKQWNGVDEPLRTILAGANHHGLVLAFLEKYHGTGVGQEIRLPVHTITGKDRFGLVQVYTEPYQIIDIGLRMLKPRELFNCQGFPREYLIAPIINGKPLSISAQVKMCGNSVSPPVAEALVRANFPDECRQPAKGKGQKGVMA